MRKYEGINLKVYKRRFDEIISKDDWGKYRDYFYSTFDSKAYKEIVKQLTNLFRKLNDGVLKKTVIFDYKSKKRQVLNKADKAVIQILFDLGYTINKDMYKTGIALKKNKEISVLDILNGFGAKKIDNMKDVFEKTKQKEIGKQIKAIEELQGLKIIKGNSIDLTQLSIYKNNTHKIVFTYDHRAIASQSTHVGWTSCMNLDKKSGHNDKVGSGASDGVFIAYFVKAGDEYVLENPVARILFKPYKGRETGKLFWKADRVYGSAPGNFKKQCQEIIDKIQGKVPSISDIYDLASKTYVDDLDKTIDTRSQEVLIKIALNVKEDYKVRLEAIEKITDQKVLSQIALNDEDAGIRSTVIQNITDQKVLNQIVLKDDDSAVRLAAIPLITNQKVLAKVALEDNDSMVKKEAVKKITDQEVLIKIALNDKDVLTRWRAVKKITNQEVLIKIALSNEDEDVRWEAVEKIKDQKVLAQIALKDEDEDVRLQAVEKITDQKLLGQIALKDTDKHIRLVAFTKITDQKLLEQIALISKDSNIRARATSKIKDQKVLAQIALKDEDEDVRMIAVTNITDQKVLGQIALKDKDEHIRLVAVDKITDKKVLNQIILNSKDEDIELEAREGLENLR